MPGRHRSSVMTPPSARLVPRRLPAAWAVMAAAAIVLAASVIVLNVFVDGAKSPPEAQKRVSVFQQATNALLNGEWRVTGRGVFGADNISIEVNPDGTKYVRVSFPGGSASPTVTRDHNRPVGGAQFYVVPRSSLPLGNVVRLRYRVRFERDFPWVKGGKLPGLYGGTVLNGGHIPDGTNGFSTRFVWRAGGAGEVYAYLPSSRDHGTSLGRGDWHFESGRWAAIEQIVRLNTPGEHNGSIDVTYNGVQVRHDTGLVFRTAGSLKIDGVFFSSFFGGDDTSWATPRTTHVDFASFSTASH